MCYCELIKWLFYTLALFYRSGEIFCVGVLCDSFGLAVRLFLYLVRLIFTLGIYSNIRVPAIYCRGISVAFVSLRRAFCCICIAVATISVITCLLYTSRCV